MKMFFNSILFVTCLGLFTPSSWAFHYGLHAFAPIAMNPSMFEGQQIPNTYKNYDVYKRQQEIVDLLEAAATMNQNQYVKEMDNSNGQQQQQQQPLPYQWAAASSEVHPQQADVCQNGFVEHCLVQANADGEQRLLLSMAINRTGNEQLTMASEFDGMCHVVIRFIECLNQHYVKCSPVEAEKNLAHTKDIFFDSWTQLCSHDGAVRKNYLNHAKCIRDALAQDNAQENCQARFQQYFLSGHFTLESIENAVHFGCCGFNEWQHCIDTHIMKNCGNGAVLAIHDLIENASGHLVSNLCDAKTFSRKSKACLGKKVVSSSKLAQMDSKVNSTLHKYIGIFADFIDRLPDEEEGNGQNDN